MTFTRSLAAVAAIALLAVPALPASAGEAESRYLQSLAGQYTGSGTIRGEDGGPVNCRLTLNPSGAKLNFRGRCSGGGGSQSFSGSIRYNDNAGRYESSSQGQTVAGRKRGQTLTFTASNDSTRGTATSTMSFSPGSISVEFDLRARNGDRTRGTIPFRRS